MGDILNGLNGLYNQFLNTARLLLKDEKKELKRIERIDNTQQLFIKASFFNL